jgi:hypothetical protein
MNLFIMLCWLTVCNDNLLSSFVPPDDFKLALLTLELEYAKARANRNDEVSYDCL